MGWRNHIRPVTFFLLEGSFSYFWPGSIASRSFTHDFAICSWLLFSKRRCSTMSSFWLESEISLITLVCPSVFLSSCHRLCPLCGFKPIQQIRFICGTNTTHEVTMCCATFCQAKMSKAKVTKVVHIKYVGLWWLRGAELIRSSPDLLVIWYALKTFCHGTNVKWTCLCKFGTH